MTDETRLAEHLGRLDGELRAVQADVTELKGDMKTLLAAVNQAHPDRRRRLGCGRGVAFEGGLLAAVNQARGGWKTILIVAGVSGAAGALLSKVGALVAWMPRIG